MLILTYSIRSILARKGSSIATIVGIISLVFTLAGTLMLLSGVRKALEEKGSPNVALVVSTGSTSESESNWSMRSASEMLADMGILDAGAHAEDLVTLLDLPRGDGTRVTTAIRGVGPGRTSLRPRFTIIEGRMATPGSAEIMVGARLRNRLAGGKVGSEIEFRRNLTVKVVGIFKDDDSFHESEIWVDRDFLQRAFNRIGLISTMRIRMASPAAVAELKAKVEHDRRFAVRVYTEPEFLKRQGAVSTGLITGLGISISILIGVGASLAVAMTMFGTVSQRRREIGVLRAIGFKRREILRAFVFEAVAFGIMSAAIGCALATVGLRGVDFSLSGGAGEELSFKFSPEPMPLLVASGLALLVSILSGLLPALRASRVPPTAAMRG